MTDRDDDLPPEKPRPRAPLLIWIILAILVVVGFLVLLRLLGPGPAVVVSQLAWPGIAEIKERTS